MYCVVMLCHSYCIQLTVCFTKETKEAKIVPSSIESRLCDDVVNSSVGMEILTWHCHYVIPGNVFPNITFWLHIQTLYTQLKKKVYTFRFVEYSEGSGPEMNLGGGQYSPWGWSQPVMDFKGSFLLSTRKITKCILTYGVECIMLQLWSMWVEGYQILSMCYYLWWCNHS